MHKHSNELAAYFYSELRRLADGEKSGPVQYLTHMAGKPCPTRPTIWGGVERARPVDTRMALPACLMQPDTQAGIAARFEHARELLVRVASC